MAASGFDTDAWSGWEVARPADRDRIDGVGMVGFRDRAAAGLDMRVIPRPAVTIVVELGDSPLIAESSTGRQRLESLVAGLLPGPVRIYGDRVECIEVHVSPPMAHALLGISSCELDGTVVDLDDLWGVPASRLREQLADADCWVERFALTRAFLARQGATARPVDPEVAASWELIVTRRGQIRVADLADACGWSRKRLWARFTTQIGLTPKRAAMLVRMDHAARALAAGGHIADVAAAGGYTDQSHLHRDIVSFVSCTPATLAADISTASNFGGPEQGTFVQDTSA